MSRSCDPRERSPEGVVRRGTRGADASIASATIASTSPVSRSCQRRRASGSSPARLATSVDHRLAVAAQQPEDPRRTAGLERQAERLVLVEPRHRRRLGRREPTEAVAARQPMPRLARRTRRRPRGPPGTPHRRSRRRSAPRRPRGRAARAWPGPRPRRACSRVGDRGRVARLVVDPVDLGQPVARRGLERVRSRSPR